MLVFEWDPEKARANEQNHEVTFAEASEVFDDDHSSSIRDPDHSLDEDRYLMFGVSKVAGIWLCPILNAMTEFDSFRRG